jgi:hypothetical protein
MTLETFNSSWIAFYDWSECAYDVISGSEWLRRDRESWLRQRMPTRVMLNIAESETVAEEWLKTVLRRRRFEAVAQEQPSLRG